MIRGSKICGISDLDTLNFIINHPYPPQFIGFICNYKKSKRYVDIEKLNSLLKLNKKKSKFVAVLVKPDKNILKNIQDLPFDYYQIYDCTPEEIQKIKKKYNKKIITALTIKDETDVESILRRSCVECTVCVDFVSNLCRDHVDETTNCYETTSQSSICDDLSCNPHHVSN